MGVHAGWCVVWRHEGVAYQVDFVSWGDAAAFARGLSETGREDVLVTPMEVELSPERADALVARTLAAIRAAEAEQRVRVMIDSIPLEEAGG